MNNSFINKKTKVHYTDDKQGKVLLRCLPYYYYGGNSK